MITKIQIERLLQQIHVRILLHHLRQFLSFGIRPPRAIFHYDNLGKQFDVGIPKFFSQPGNQVGLDLTDFRIHDITVDLQLQLARVNDFRGTRERCFQRRTIGKSLHVLGPFFSEGLFGKGLGQLLAGVVFHLLDGILLYFFLGELSGKRIFDRWRKTASFPSNDFFGRQFNG